MIISNEGSVQLLGSTEDILADLGCVILSVSKTLLIHNKHTIEQTKDKIAYITSIAVTDAIKMYEKEKKDDRK